MRGKGRNGSVAALFLLGGAIWHGGWWRGHPRLQVTAYCARPDLARQRFKAAFVEVLVHRARRRRVGRQEGLVVLASAKAPAANPRATGDAFRALPAGGPLAPISPRLS
jgi:hypothetical protein